MQVWFTLVCLLVILTLAVVACGPAATTETLSPLSTPTPAHSPPVPSPTLPDTPTDEPFLSPLEETVDLPAGSETVVAKTRQDLAERLLIDPDQVRVVSVEAVQWRDSSLGCPQPGMNYLQVITPGYRIELEVGGEIYTYHAGQERAIYCGEPAITGGAEPTPKDQLVAAARADLAGRLGVAEDEIEVASVERVEWRDGSLGCPQPGMMYPQVITPGYRIVLSAGGQEYDYRASLKGVFLCEQ